MVKIHLPLRDRQLKKKDECRERERESKYNERKRDRGRGRVMRKEKRKFFKNLDGHFQILFLKKKRKKRKILNRLLRQTCIVKYYALIIFKNEINVHLFR